VLPGVLSYGAYSFLQRELGAARTALMLYLTPVYAPLLAWLLLGEVPQAGTTWPGAALILPSIWLAVTRRPSAASRMFIDALRAQAQMVFISSRSSASVSKLGRTGKGLAAKVAAQAVAEHRHAAAVGQPVQLPHLRGVRNWASSISRQAMSVAAGARV
jgi:hypothetical protein